MRADVALSSIRHLSRLAASALLVALAALAARADRTEPVPADLAGVGIDDRAGARLPLETTFTDDGGAKVALGSLFRGDRPVVVTLNYSSCPMLCSLQMDGLLEAMLGIDWTAGRDFDVVTVSIDPAETTARAAETRRKLLRIYGRPEGAQGWRFLTGEERAIRALADAIGFRYRYLPERKEYAHAAALFLCSPDGTLARTLPGVKYPARELRLALVEASRGELGALSDKAVLYCLRYDPAAQRYTLAAMSLMRGGGAVAMVATAALVLLLRRRETRDRAAARAPLASAPAPVPVPRPS